VYDVRANIGGSYYQGSGKSVIAVFDPSLGFVTGGGAIIRTVNGQTLAADFSTNLKYQKNGTLVGSMTYVEHRSTGDVTFASSTIDALALTGSEAKITGSGSLNSIAGYSFLTRLIDNGEPGSNDQIGLRITDSGGNVVADVTFAPANLSSGNIRVH
jgi:hypothetical protein